MKLILTREVAGLGLAGDIVEVADGYGRNFLVPARLRRSRGRKGAEKQITQIKRARDAREIRDLGHAREIKADLEKLDGHARRRAGEGGRLFGSITAATSRRRSRPRAARCWTSKRIQLARSHQDDRIAHRDRRAAPRRRGLRAGHRHRSSEPHVEPGWAPASGTRPGRRLGLSCLAALTEGQHQARSLACTTKYFCPQPVARRIPRDSRLSSVSRPAIHTAVHRASTSAGGVSHSVVHSVGAQARLVSQPCAA